MLLLVTQSDWGGVQKFLCDFARDLHREGREVLLAAGGEGELLERARELGIRTHHLSHVHRSLNVLEDLRALFEIRSLIHAWQPDAIHLNSSKTGVLGSLAAIGLKSRVVYRIGGWSFLEPMTPLARWVYRCAERLTASFKDRILVVHPGDLPVGRSIGISETRMRVAPNGLSVTHFQLQLLPRSEARTILGLPEHGMVFGTIANSYPAKALDEYIDVAHRVLLADGSAEVCIIGDGPEHYRLQKKVENLPCKDRIHLAGRRLDASTLLAAFDVFVLPSKKEGMPWTILEAMAAALPVIATDVGACQWMIEDRGYPACGVIVPSHDSLALESAMHALRIDAERRERLGRAGAENVRARFSWDQTFACNRDAIDGAL